MNEDIAIISCPPWGVVMPPLGIAYLSSYLRAKGIRAKIYDLNLQLYKKANESQKRFWELDTINKISPIVIAHDLFSNFENLLGEFIKELKHHSIIGCSANNLISTTFVGLFGQRIKEYSKDKIIILGGPGCYHSWDRKSVPEAAVDFFVIGEGEETFYQLIKNIQIKKNNFKNLVSIPGVLPIDTKSRQEFIPRQYIKDLDSIPFPTFEEFNLSEYSNGNKYRPLPILMSRGCINQCSYCIDYYMCSPFRVRNPEQIVGELQYHKEHYGLTHVEFNDLLCNGNLYQLERLCDRIIDAKLDINWISYAAIRNNMTEELLAKMRKAGCTSLCYGIESGSDNVLKRMNKHYTSAQATSLIEKTHQAGIEVRINIIVGFPGETKADFQQTLDFITENRKYIKQVTNVSSFVLMPGSDLGVYPHRFGVKFLDPLDPGKWTDENGLVQTERNKRVDLTCEHLKQLKIKNLIINYQQQLNKDCSFVEKEEEELTEDSAEPFQGKEQLLTTTVKKKIKYLRKQKVTKLAVLFSLFIFTLIMDFYLMLLKKIRGSIIFPGS